MPWEVTPGYTKVINLIYLGKILTLIIIFEAVIGYVLNSITKGKRDSRIGKYTSQKK